MSLDLVEVHEALAAQIAANISRATHVYAFDPGDGGRSYPCVVVRPREPWVEYHRTMGDNALASIMVEVAVMVAATEIDARRALADYASNDSSSASSIRAAVEKVDSAGKRTLGGVVCESVCYRAGVPVPFDEGDGVEGWELGFEVELWEARS